MVGLRLRHKREWVTDGTLDGLWPTAERAGVPVALAAVTEYGIALATLDDDPSVRPLAHIFVATKVPWFELTNDLPQFATVPPSR
jgi:hypothetical protein